MRDNQPDEADETMDARPALEASTFGTSRLAVAEVMPALASRTSCFTSVVITEGAAAAAGAGSASAATGSGAASSAALAAAAASSAALAAAASSATLAAAAAS